MSKNHKHNKCLTTVAVFPAVLDQIKQDATLRGIPNHEVVRRAMLAYSKKAQATAAPNEHQAEEPSEILARIDKALLKLSQRDDVVIGFIREQEKKLLHPIFSMVNDCVESLKQINDNLEEL